MPARKPTAAEAADREALARLVERVGTALVDFANDLRGTAPRTVEESGSDGVAAPTGRRLTDREQLVLGLEGISGEHGVSSGEVAKAAGWPQSNADQVLRRLAAKELLVELPGKPRRWRKA